MSCGTSYIVIALLITVLLAVVWWDSLERFTVHQQNWADMSRGMNTPNTFGYEPTVELLRHMEIAKSGNIDVNLTPNPVAPEVAAAVSGSGL